jgi:hypothetical protein
MRLVADNTANVQATAAWNLRYRHIAGGGIVASYVRSHLREGRYAEAIEWFEAAAEFLPHPIPVRPAQPNRGQRRARSRGRNIGRRLDRRRGERTWRGEWDFALRLVAA